VGLALETLPLAVNSQTAANVAQLFIGAALVSALLVGLYQVRVTRTLAKREVAYTYFERFTSAPIRRRIVASREFWEANDWRTFQALPRWERNQLLVVPNLIEELAHAYNRKHLDRGVAALVLGALVEDLWERWQELITEGKEWRGQWVYCEWARMQADTRTRRPKEHDKSERWDLWRAKIYGPPANYREPPF
jgi:hypothetical protein